MRIEAIWGELEAEADTPGASAWLTRLALPLPSQKLIVAIETLSRRRYLLVELPEKLIPSPSAWPRSRGLEVVCIRLNSTSHFGVRLVDQTATDVFSVLAEDLARRIAISNDASTTASILITRLKRWQQLLSTSGSTLSKEEVRGLYGELVTLREIVLAKCGPCAAIQSWRAPAAAHQDFQFATAAIEVKTTASKQPQNIRITSERQLDETGTGRLFLHVIVLDEREINDDSHEGPTESLPDAVAEVRRLVGYNLEALSDFEDKLVDSRYLDSHADGYRNTRFAIRRTHSFRVDGNFPRIVERNLMPGIGDVTYSLSLASCEPFSVATDVVIAAVDAG